MKKDTSIGKGTIVFYIFSNEKKKMKINTESARSRFSSGESRTALVRGTSGRERGALRESIVRRLDSVDLMPGK